MPIGKSRRPDRPEAASRGTAPAPRGGSRNPAGKKNANSPARQIAASQLRPSKIIERAQELRRERACRALARLDRSRDAGVTRAPGNRRSNVADLIACVARSPEKEGNQFAHITAGPPDRLCHGLKAALPRATETDPGPNPLQPTIGRVADSVPNYQVDTGPRHTTRSGPSPARQEAGAPGLEPPAPPETTRRADSSNGARKAAPQATAQPRPRPKPTAEKKSNRQQKQQSERKPNPTCHNPPAAIAHGNVRPQRARRPHRPTPAAQSPR